MGLILQPYWSPGLKSPALKRTGAIIGFGDVHTGRISIGPSWKGWPTRCARGWSAPSAGARRRSPSCRVSGGGSQSDAAMQITAGRLGLPTARPHLYETSGLGAALVAAVGLGLHPDFAAAVAAMTRVGQTFAPDPRRTPSMTGCTNAPTSRCMAGSSRCTRRSGM